MGYQYSSGTLENIEVRNQNPGGCGSGLVIIGSPFVVTNPVSVRQSSIHEFDDTGVLAISGGGTGFLVNLTSSWIESASTSVQSGVYYQFTYGLVAHNTIVVDRQYGLLLENFFGSMTINENTIVGSTVGIFSGSSEGANTITHNNLFNNGTGIFVSGLAGSPVVKSNTITQSSTAAIDVGCSEETTAENNIIVNSPIGIAEVNTGELFEQSQECKICGNEIHSFEDSTVDHIHPYSKGGKTVRENGQLAHRGCNARKNMFVPDTVQS